MSTGGGAGVAEEAWAGDIIGIPNHGQLRIGDTLTEGEALRVTGIPSFAPELLQSCRAGDPMKADDTTVISMSQGLYGGAAIGGLGVTIDEKLMLKSYGAGTNPHDVLDGNVEVQAGAEGLWKELDR